LSRCGVHTRVPKDSDSLSDVLAGLSEVWDPLPNPLDDEVEDTADFNISEPMTGTRRRSTDLAEVVGWLM